MRDEPEFLFDAVKLARPILERAQKNLGKDLSGLNAVDLFADNFPRWSISLCRDVAKVVLGVYKGK